IKLPVDDRWEAGNYIVEIESKDVYDQPVLSKSKFKLKGDNSSSVTNNLIVFHSLDKSKYTAGDKVNFTIGSASDDVTVTVDIEKDHKVISTQLIHLSNNTHTFSIPVKKSDTQGFAIHFHLVNYNGFKAGTQIINVYEPKEELHIETATFRDKLQPGAKETWSFTINGSKKARAETEVLASMYDASLDQFKSHNWSFDPKIKSRYYTNNQSRAYNSFRTENFRIRNLLYPSFYIREQQFDRQDWFGFSLDNNKYVQQQYLQRLSVIYYDTIRQESKITISNDNKRQDGFVYGRIVDLQGALLPGVNVIVKGTKRGTVTDMNGEYAIRVGKGEALEFSYIGYVNTGVEVGKENIIDVQLSEDITRLEEIVVVGYGVRKKASLTGSVVTIADEETVIEEIVFEEAPEEELAGRMAGVSVTNAAGDAYKLLIRGVSSVNDNSNPLYVVDGKVIMDASQISEDDLASISVLKGSNATALYGARAANGVILITTKSGQKKLDEELAKVRARKNLKETAFFYPHLKTDKKGNISFSFDTPEALTRWKLQLLAHTKNVTSATKTLQAVTTKDLMIIPNAPRFLRQGDELVISAKVTNLTSNTMNGMIGLQLSDPFTGEDVNEEFDNLNRNKSFKVNSQGNTEVSWRLSIPENKDIVQYRIVAKANDFSDGEQNVLPILSNRMLITETLPMQVRTGESKTFSLEKLNNNNSSTLRHHLLTLEVTSNPTWYALQALPYLMEFPHECAEQTFARYYANALAKHIIDKNDDIKNVFESWSAKGEIRSNLESNEDLKSIMIQETPWLRDAQSEKAQKERISTLFDESYLKESLDASIYKLELMQLSNGGFPWFSGSHLPNRYITQHIVLGLAHLQHLNVDFENFKANYILKNGLKYLDNQILMDYNDLLSRAEEYYSTIESKEEYLKKNHLRPIHIQYLYMHSYFHDSIISEKSKPAYDYFKNQSMVYWQDFNPYMKGMIALIQHRAENLKMAKDIIHSLKENSITNEELGMYWKKNAESWHWFYAPIETQSLLIEAISEIEANDTTQTEQEKVRTIDYLKIWLLKNKQTNRWPTTKSTTEAIYALLLEGSDWLSVTEQVEVSIGNQKIEPENQPEVATGYYKAAWASEEIGPSKSNVTMTKKDQGIAWGSLYWQYFEDLDKITPAETPLKLSKAIFNVINTSSGQVLQAVDDTTRLQVGDLIRVRIELSADRPMEYLHMKDMRAAGMEPVNVLSEYKWQDGLGYYESTRDASTNFFFDHLPKGVYVFEYDLRVNNSGHFSNGITTIQSMYAPEYSSHSEGVKVIVE
ncbi:MAG: carboxypeptidase-like regulatory domain-containing protein, partial [Cytophagales bacterium]|nr:carboxypeptidase-like regulatory domain-containing protein [Cytophagales bacterium]